MAERWQQWMPFHIDRWRGSPSVQAMHPAAQMGYLNLLCSCWQSTDCCVPSDPIDLATESRLGDEMWVLYGPRILRKFVDIAGRWRNDVLFGEWEDARRVYEKRKSGAVRTNTSRSAFGERTHTERQADTQTLTGTVTSTEATAKPSRAKTLRGEATKSDLIKTRHTEFKEKIKQYWEYKNPGVEMPWGPAEGKQLAMWMQESPLTTTEQFTEFLRNRAKSEVNHAERPSRWLGNITSFANGPLNTFRQPLNGGKSNGKIERSVSVAEKLIAEFENNSGADQRELLPGG